MEAFIFPGQGSQRRGMGKELFDSVEEFAAIEDVIDSILGYSIRDLCLNDRDNRLKETQFTQPALYVVNALHYFSKARQAGYPRYVAGHSLGEFNALLAGGAFDLLTGLKLVKRRGELMGGVRNGAMAAVIGPTASELEQLLRERSLASIDVANYNSPTQTVISGTVEDIDVAGIALKSKVQLFIRLPVSAAFHSRYMREVAVAFRIALSEVTFRELSIPVISNVTAQPYPAGASAREIGELLVRQIASPVRWEASIRRLKSLGVSQFTEVGPGNVLTKLLDKMPADDW